MKVISTEKLPVKMWLNDIEDGAIQQAKNLANLPFAFKHIAIMPDAHQGYGMPIGGVLATKGEVIPNAVEVDIGCGMSSFNTGFKDFSIDGLKHIMGEIRKAIPVGMNSRKEMCFTNEIPDASIVHDGSVVMKEINNARYSMGTLGGGNHFIELQKDQENNLHVMIHSGSRNLGKKVADYYKKLAIELNEKYFSSIPKNWDLAFFPKDSIEKTMYLNEMNYCLDYAFLNRKKMMDIILDIIGYYYKINIDRGNIINIHHNYASMEHHFNMNVMIHRKGATSAREGQIGIIPGSQGSKSHIVKGKGNPQSFMSCSNSAGRKMGREQAKKNLDLDVEKKRLDDQGIIHGIRSVSDLDEAAGAYKDISEVMENQKELVEIVSELSPLGVIKG